MSIFWENFVSVCTENGVKPTPILKELGISTGSIGRWQKNGNITSENLLKISERFNVSVDYLLTGKEFSPSKEDPRDSITDDELEMIKMYRALPEAVQEVAYSSIKTGYDAEMRRIAEERRLLG